VSCRIEGSRDHGTFHVGETSVSFRFLDAAHVEILGKRHRFYVIRNRDCFTVWLDGRTYYLERARTTADASPSLSGPAAGEIRAVMPGKLVRLTVAPGEKVSEKQVVAIMESMKMESELLAPFPGRVSEIRFKPGDVLEMGDIVMSIEPLEAL
jgi:acetyl/propionyl-CoA carboxylase alpha subunit